MKFVVYVAIAASLFHIAEAVYVNEIHYSDANCTTARASTANIPNPFIATLNVCTKYFTFDGYPTEYIIQTACVGGYVTAAKYSDSSRTTKISDHGTGLDTCHDAGGGVYVFIYCTSAPTTNPSPGPTSAPSPASTPVKTSPANSLQSAMPLFVAIATVLYF
jgi:hypothetical protein